MSAPTVIPADHPGFDAHGCRVGGDPNPEQATRVPTPTDRAPARPQLPADQVERDAQTMDVGGDPNCGSDQPPTGAQAIDVAVAPTSPDPTRPRSMPRCAASGPGTLTPEQAIGLPTPSDGAPARAPLPPASAMAGAVPEGPPPALGETDDQRGSARRLASPNDRSLSLADPLLALAADVLDDLERVRIANENRLRQLTRTEEDSDGLERGFGLPVDHPDVKRLAALVDGLAVAEHSAELNLKRQLRQHPLGPWVKQARGVGEKQAARLLASIGDPYWNTLHHRPRTVSELWAYSGYHVLPTGQNTPDTQEVPAGGGSTGGNPDQRANGAQRATVGVAASRSRGQRANWSAIAKMRAHLVAVSIVKAGGPYRDVYDATRAKYAEALHQVECKRCGPAGKPAPAGSPLSAGHQHFRALRAVAKEVLRDLWREAKRLHEEAGGMTAPQPPASPGQEKP